MVVGKQEGVFSSQSVKSTLQRTQILQGLAVSQAFFFWTIVLSFAFLNYIVFANFENQM